MSRGGKRDGAGRPKGAANRMSQKAREAASAGGELPHEFLLRVARGGVIRETVVRDGVQTVEEREPTLAERMDAAKAAAPFYAPKMASVEMKAKVESSFAEEVRAFVGQLHRSGACRLQMNTPPRAAPKVAE